MSCHLSWNFNDYKRNSHRGKEVNVEVLTTPVTLSNVENNTLTEIKGNLVLDITKTLLDKIDGFQETYNIVHSCGKDVIGSLYVVTYYQQPASDGFQTLLSNVTGTVSCKGIFSQFNNGMAVIQFDNKTGRRCLTLYENALINSSDSEPAIPPMPKLAGDWTYEGSILRRKSLEEKPDLKQTITIPPSPVVLSQENHFVVMELPKDITRPKDGYLLGVLTYVHNHWKLTFSDYDDNGVFNLNEVEKDVWEGAYTESGFLGSTEQFQSIGIITLKKR